MGRTACLWVVPSARRPSWWWDRQIRTGDLLLAKPDRALLSPVKMGNGAGRGRLGVVRGCLLGTGWVVDQTWTQATTINLPSRGFHAGMFWHGALPGQARQGSAR